MAAKTDWTDDDFVYADDLNNLGVEVNSKTGKGELVINIKDYGAVGDGTTNDTVALQAAFAAAGAGPSKTVIIPPGRFTYAADLTIPKSTIVRGSGYGYQGTANPASRLKATHADARILVDDHVSMENLYIDGDNVAKWAIQTVNSIASKPIWINVRLANFTQAGFVFNMTQNGILINCTARNCVIGYWFLNGAANFDLYGCTYENWTPDLVGVGGSAARAVLISTNTTDPRLSGGTAFAGGGRDIRFWGGIFETGSGDYRIEILDGSSYGGNIMFTGSQFSHSDNPDGVAMVYMGPDVGGQCDLVLDNCVWATSVYPNVIAEGGRIKYRNHRMSGSAGKNVMGMTVLSGTAVAFYDEQTRNLINSQFQTGLYASESFNWTTYATGTISWNSTKKCADIFMPSTTAGIRAYFFGREEYAQPYGNITIRFKIAGANGPVRLNTWAPGNVMATVGVFDNGAHEVVHELVGGETALVLTSDSSLDVNAELRYLTCEHGGTGGNPPAVAAPTSTAFTNTSTVTAAGTTTLTVDSTPTQVFTGTTTQTVVLPTTGVLAGQQWRIVNNSTGTLTISGLHSLAGGKAALYTAITDAPAGGSSWHFLFLNGATAATASSTAMRDGSGNLTSDAFIATATSTVTSAGTLTMTITSAATQVFTGSSTHTVLLPTTSVTAGQPYTIINNSTGAITVQSSGANMVATVAAGTLQLFIAQVATPTTAAHWRAI